MHLTDQEITDALLAGGGILTDAARHLSERLGQPVSRAMIANRVEGSRVLTAIRQIAEERAFKCVIAAAKQRRQERRSAAMKDSWAKRKQQPAGVAVGTGDAGIVDEPNVRARARASSALTPATVQAERDRRLCCAKTRNGFP